MTPRPDPNPVLLARECAHKCAWCDWAYTGPAAEGMQLAKEHREQAHGVTVRTRKRGIGTCGVFTCNLAAVKRVQGRGLCPEHLAVVQANAERRGWTTAIGGTIRRQDAA